MLGIAGYSFISCGFPFVMTQQPTQPFVSLNDPDLLVRRKRSVIPCSRIGSVWR